MLQNQGPFGVQISGWSPTFSCPPDTSEFIWVCLCRGNPIIGGLSLVSMVSSQYSRGFPHSCQPSFSSNTGSTLSLKTEPRLSPKNTWAVLFAGCPLFFGMRKAQKEHPPCWGSPHKAAALIAWFLRGPSFEWRAEVSTWSLGRCWYFAKQEPRAIGSGPRCSKAQSWAARESQGSDQAFRPLVRASCVFVLMYLSRNNRNHCTSQLIFLQDKEAEVNSPCWIDT